MGVLEWIDHSILHDAVKQGRGIVEDSFALSVYRGLSHCHTIVSDSLAQAHVIVRDSATLCHASPHYQVTLL